MKQLRANFSSFPGRSLSFLLLCGELLVATDRAESASEPRIVNIYNFVCNSDYRLSHSEDALFAELRRGPDKGILSASAAMTLIER